MNISTFLYCICVIFDGLLSAQGRYQLWNYIFAAAGGAFLHWIWIFFLLSKVNEYYRPPFLKKMSFILPAKIFKFNHDFLLKNKYT